MDGRYVILLFVGSAIVSLLAQPAASSGQCPDVEHNATFTVGGSGTDIINSISQGVDGHLNIAGEFEDTVDFDPGPEADWHTSAGGQDIYVTRMSPDGVQDYALTFQDALGYEDGEEALSVPAGGFFVYGDFKYAIDVDPGTGEDWRYATPPWSQSDLLLIKLSELGVLEWAYTYGGDRDEDANAAAINDSGVIALVGTFIDNPVDFDPTEGEDIHEAAGLNDAFVTTLASDGSYRWTVTFGNPGNDSAEGVAVDGAGDVYVSGSFEGTMNFDPNESPGAERTSAGDWDAFLAKYSPDGDWLWTATFGGEGFDAGGRIAVTADGAVYLVGSFSGTVDFDPGAGVAARTAAGATDMFAVRLNADGSYAWSWSAGLPDDILDGDRPINITVNDTGDALISGEWGVAESLPGDTVDFDPGPDEDIHILNGGCDAFFTYLYADGTYGWTWTVGGPERDQGTVARFLDDGQILVAGTFSLTVDFDPQGSGDVRTSNGYFDTFWTILDCADEVPCDGDANGDGVVDPLDSGYVLSRFGCPVNTGDEACDAADQNGDSVVDPLDVGFVLARFGTCE